jgi:hypothetical protein
VVVPEREELRAPTWWRAGAAVSAGGWTYDDADVSARVETLRRGDRIYLPGAGPSSRGGGGRVVSSVEVCPARSADEVPPRGLPPHVIVSYFTGARARPVMRDRDDHDAGELVEQSLRWLEVGTRVRCRRCRPTT